IEREVAAGINADAAAVGCVVFSDDRVLDRQRLRPDDTNAAPDAPDTTAAEGADDSAAAAVPHDQAVERNAGRRLVAAVVDGEDIAVGVVSPSGTGGRDGDVGRPVAVDIAVYGERTGNDEIVQGGCLVDGATGERSVEGDRIGAVM